jgi:hypothetical protein
MSKHLATILAAAFAFAVSSTARADLLVDDFEDSASNLTSNWEDTPWGQNSSTFPFSMVVGAGFAARSTSTATAAFSPKWAYVRTTVTGWPDAVYGYGDSAAPPAALVTVAPYNWPTSPTSYTTWGSALPASNRANPAERYQSLTLSMGNGLSTDLNMNATGPNPQDANYVRVTAWRDPAVTPAAGAFFALSLIAVGPNIATPGNMSTGPWDETGTNLVGMPITTTPQTFILDVRNTTLFKIDPVYALINPGTSTLTNANFGNLLLMQFGYRRNGADAGDGPLDARFYIDDVMILKNKPAFSFSSNSVSVTEGGSNTLSVALTAMPARNVVLDLTSLNVSEITVSPAQLTFTRSNWASPQTVTFTSVNDDLVDEAPQDFTVTKSRSNSVDQWYRESTDTDLVASLGDITVTVIDNDPAPGAFFASSALLSLAETDGPISVEVQLPVAAAETLTVNIAGTGAAISGTDYTLSTTTLTFLPGETSQSFDIDPTDDLLDEDDETGTLTIVSQSSGTPGSPASRPIIIADNDPEPSVEFTTAPGASVSEPAGSTLVTASLSAPSGKTVTVDVAAGTGAGTEFTASPTTLTFLPGATAQDVTVAALDDLLDEDPEVATIMLQNPTNATLGANTSYNVTLNDDDPEPEASWGTAWDPASLTEPSGSASLAVTLSAPSGKTVTVSVLVNAGSTATEAFDFTIASSSLTFAPGDTLEEVSVSIVDDPALEGPETVLLDFGTLVNATTTAGVSPTLTLISEDVSSISDWTVLD